MKAMQGALFGLPGITALVLLVVNNWLLKKVWPGVVSGKLSDVAGVALLSFWLAAVFRLGVRRDVASFLGAAAAGGYLTFIKTTVTGSDFHASLINGFLSFVGLGTGYVLHRDVTDLLALLVLPAVVWADMRGEAQEAKR